MNQVCHIVTIRIYPDKEQKPMTEKQISKWVMGHFEGSDYGYAQVTNVINENVKEVATQKK